MGDSQFAGRGSPNGASPEVPGAPLAINHEPLGDSGWLFEIEGELDLASADRMRDALDGPIRDRARHIVIDLSRCTFVDSSGLAELIRAKRTLNGASGGPGVAIVAPSPQPRRLLKMTAVETFLPVFESRREAEAAIGD
jgi:anti-anti-sigma factor